MPAPLFQYVWQYNNQPIEQLAIDIVNVLGANGTSPVNTANYIPVSNGLTFDNSTLYSSPNYLKTTFTPDPGNTIWGIEFDYQTRNIIIGDFNAGFQTNTLSGNTGVFAVDINGPVGNQVLLDLNSSLQLMKTDFGVNGDRFGFKLDFANGLYFFGEYAGVGNVPQLKVDVPNTTVNMMLDGNGLNIFKLGLDIDGIVMDADESITSAGLSGTYINVKVNGVPYKLALYSL